MPVSWVLFEFVTEMGTKYLCGVIIIVGTRYIGNTCIIIIMHKAICSQVSCFSRPTSLMIIAKFSSCKVYTYTSLIDFWANTEHKHKTQTPSEKHK